MMLLHSIDLLLLRLLYTIFSTSIFSTAAAADLILDGDPTWQTNQWYAQIDGVMGGQSSGQLSFINSNTILSFSGTISLDGGGFSSVRRKFDNVLDLSSFAGIVITLQTTAEATPPPLGLHLQFHDETSSFGYASAFAIPLTNTAGEETSIFLPLSSFDRGTRIGFQCNECEIDWRYINEMDLYVLFQEGDFSVQVKSISAVENVTSYASPAISIADENEIGSLVQETIKSGSSLYDYDYKELCIAVYRSALNSLLAVAGEDGDSLSDVVSKTIKGMICQGLQRADSQGNDKVDVAWALRHTLDSILEEIGLKEEGQDGSWRPDASTAKTYQCNGVTSGSGAYTIVSSSIPPTQTPTAESTIAATTTMNPTNMSSLIPSPVTADNESNNMITSSSSMMSNAGIVSVLCTAFFSVGLYALIEFSV